MRINNYVMINMIKTLEAFADKRLPQKISYAITKNINILMNEYQPYSKTLEKLIKQFENQFILKDGVPIFDKRGIPKVNNKSQKELDKQINDLLQIELDVRLCSIPDSVFAYDDLSGYDPLTVKDIMLLEAILCEDTEGGIIDGNTDA